MRDDREIELVAQRHFTDAERAALDGAPERRSAFFRVWARKEAVLKARGTGFATEDTSPDGFDVIDLAVDRFHAAAVATTFGAVRLLCAGFRPRSGVTPPAPESG
jgi:phosphopantetheinyl transferase